MTVNLGLLNDFWDMNMMVLLGNFYFTPHSLVAKTRYVEGGEKTHSSSLRKEVKLGF